MSDRADRPTPCGQYETEQQATVDAAYAHYVAGPAHACSPKLRRPHQPAGAKAIQKSNLAVSSRAGPAQQQESGMSGSRDSGSAVNTMSLACSGVAAGLPVHGCRLHGDGPFTVTCCMPGVSGFARRCVAEG